MGNDLYGIGFRDAVRNGALKSFKLIVMSFELYRSDLIAWATRRTIRC